VRLVVRLIPEFNGFNHNFLGGPAPYKGAQA
jgi:hypothetical protein